MKKLLRSRGTANLSDSLLACLNSYALAATAAGVGTLALGLPAEAKIIYTKAHQDLRTGIFLDLNHDGVIDFGLPIRTTQLESSQHLSSLSVDVYRSNSMNRIVGSSKNEAAAALHAGARIGSANLPRGDMAVVAEQRGEKTLFYGQWANNGKGVTNRYLGLKFLVNGKAHYGWARLSVWFRDHTQIEGVLSGYAYETIPDKPIIAGKAKGPSVVTVQPGNLGHLARGAVAIPAWRGTSSPAGTRVEFP